jgi:hypothetical protein
MQQHNITPVNPLSSDQGEDTGNKRPEPGISLFDIREEVERLSRNIANPNNGLFLVQPANTWIKEASKRPIPKMLYGKLWFEGEICILFADTNLGKSILAVQIADSISKGAEIRGFPMEAEKQLVLYFDYELSDKQFEVRYSMNYQNHYPFDDNFLRAEIDPEKADFHGEGFNNLEDYINASLEQSIINTRTKVLIIDNLTYLRSETEKAKDALPLMKQLKALKRKYNLSILALAHTPKRDSSKPITRNDLQGSKMLINFCDSSFAIGESFRDKRLRYIIQIKARNTEIVYDTENVALCQIDKPSNFLQFEFLNFSSEREHLKPQSETDRSTLIEKAKELSGQGKSQRQIATELNLSVGAVNKYLKS